MQLHNFFEFHFLFFVVSACLHYGIVKQIYPLHDDELIKKLGHTWYMQFFQCPPFGKDDYCFLLVTKIKKKVYVVILTFFFHLQKILGSILVNQ